MVEFVVRVPENTSPEQHVYLAGEGFALGEWSADRVRLDRQDDGTYRAWLPIPHGVRSSFLVTLGRWREVESDAHGHELAPRTLSITEPATIKVNVHSWGRRSVRYHANFPSEYLPSSRTLAVWVPPGYDLQSLRHYPVLYM